MIFGTIANLDAIDNQQPNAVIIAENNKPVDTVGLPPDLKPPSSEKAVVDKPDDNPFPKPNDGPFPSDRRSSRRKLPPKPLHVKATAPLDNEDVAKKVEPAKPPLPEPQSDNLNLRQSNQQDASIVKTANVENVAANGEQTKNTEIGVEPLAPNAKPVDLVDKDAIANEEKIVEEEAAANAKPLDNAGPGLKEMVANVAKEMEETQNKVRLEMDEIKKKMLVLENQQRQNDQPANAQDANAQNVDNSNAQSKKVELPNEPNANMQKGDAHNSIVQNLSETLVVKETVVEESDKIGKVPAVPIPKLLASGSHIDTKSKPNADTVQTANDGVAKEKSENKPPSDNDNTNNFGGRDLLSEKADDSIKTL